jgi:hypothetical protein
MGIIATGTYENGQIKLDSIPAGIERARVRVEFEETSETKTRKRTLTFGMFKVPGARQTEWEDFQVTKKQWQPKEQ